MLSLKDLNPDQEPAITHIYETGQTYLVGEMGSGKTVVMLTAAAELLRDGVVKRVLVVSTSKIVRDVWPNEPAKWKELTYLEAEIAVMTGQHSEAQRNKVIKGDAKIVCVNFEMLPWLFENYGDQHGFDMLCVDEVTKFKAGGVQFKKLRPRLKDFKIRVVATGTPVEENWLGLFYPMMVCDNGTSFGRNSKAFKFRYFFPTDYNAYNWELQPDGAERILQACKDRIVRLPDYTHELPELTEVRVPVQLDLDTTQRYAAFALSLVDKQASVVAQNAAVLTNKLQQFASGFLYLTEDEARENTEQIHNLKIPALLAACTKAKGVKRIWAYQFDEEKRRLADQVSGIVFLDGKDDAAVLAAWRKGYTANLALHPKSAGHGLDLTAATELMLCSPMWSRDQMRQLIARMRRRGQTEPTRMCVAVAEGTIDEEIVAREAGKARHHELFKKHYAKISGSVLI